MEADKQFGKGRGSILLKLLKEKEKVENEEILQGISSTLNASNNAKESKNQTEFNLQSVIEIPSSSTIGRGRASLLQILKEMKSSETLQSKPIQTISSGRGSLLSRLKATSLNETSLQQPNIAKNSSDDAGVVGKLSDITIQENKPKSEASCKPMSHQGTEGEPIQLGANYINLKLDPAKGLFNYEVKFNPDIDSRPLRRKLLNQHVQALGRTKVFDGVTLYLPQKLKQDINLFTSIHPMDESKVELKVIYKKQQSISENIPFFNVLLGRVMRALSLVRIGQHSFNPKGIHCVPQHKLEVWPGYVTAINEYDGGLKLCIDARHRVMRTETVRDIMMKFGGKPNFKDIIIRELIGLSVFTRYNNKTYRIDDIAWDKNPTYEFDKGTDKISLINYYKLHWNLEITDNGQPLLVHCAKNKLSTGETQEQLILLVPELCYLASLSDSIRSDFRVMKDLDSLTKMSPNARCDVFRHFVEQVRSNSVPREILSEWGLELESDIAEFTGRVFGPEQIQFANTKFIPPPAKPAEWSSAVCRNTVLRTPNLNHWCVLYCQKDTRCTQEFVGMLKNVAKVIGMNVREPQMICLRDDRIETYVQALKKNIDQTVNLMVIVFPTNRTDRYSAVKRVCCVEMPVPSQVIMSRTISRGDKLKSITEKIALQINCKLGGALWALAIPMDHCMICGIDVYHAGVGQSMKGSVAGFVASLDKLLTSWHSKICLQGKHQELVDILQICLISAIKAYYRRNKRYPDRIIVYRDGVGDGQLDTVAKYEVKQLLATFKTIEINYQPTLTVIVVQKRINTRLFEISSTGLKNPPPGTIVDSHITKPALYDFFLVSQNIRQEHVWQVTMQKKGLGERKNIHGPYRLCLTDRTLSLVKIGAKDNSDSIEFPLICIRRCGYMDRIFYMEVGRSAVTGGGELWMEAEDNNIAHNMHAAIMNSMSNSSSSKDDVGPRQRVRSSSATEASKPIFVLPHRYTGQRFYNSPLGANGRDRCDSLPSRGRTTSESHPTSIISHPRSSHFVSHVMRPHSMYVKGVSYSPPISSMPISPASGACSTDSAGSSLSMDDGGENVLEEGTVSRYGHSLTPDEPVILEENGDDYAPWSTSHSHHKYSPNFKSHSPSQQSSYLEMCSPCGSSPGPSGAYMPMSSGTGHSHSRGSSLVEESNTLPEGYVPMAPVGNNGYVDMDPSHNHNGHFPDDLSHGGSSCSVTSGTPSTDLRFSEYHLDKVTSFLPPGDDLQARPARAYSIGSRPEPIKSHRKNRLDITQQDVSRVRAFSVGSRSKKPELGKLVNVVTAPLPVGCENSSSNKSNSAPLLSSSWGHNSGCSITSERMEDLMELDFTKPSISTTFNSPPSSYSQPQSQSHSFSTATDTSSYVDMSPGQPPSSTTAPYVDMSRINKINRNNNNNTITANQNHSHIHVSSSASIHKPVITTLKPVEEAEGPYMRMDGIMEDWSQSGSSPKLISSPMQEESVQSNGPPGATRTAPVDLPRRPPADYVDMNFKPRTSLEQDYINMNMSNRNNRKPMATRTGSRKEKSRSQPIAIQAGNKPIKTPSFLPLNGSPESESLASTPASPPRATPTGSSATIFPFSLNSPQSPEKSFTHQKNTDELKPSELNMNLKHNNDRTIADATNGRVSTINSISVTDANSSTLSKVMIKDRASSPTGKDNQVNRIISNNSLTSQDNTLNNVTKKFSDLNVSKPRLITASPNTSPTLSGFKPTIEKQPSSPKLPDETPTPTPTAMPSPLEKENFDKVQAAAEILHYASLDLPEVGNAAPMSPASQEGFNYAKIDFAKLKQN